LTFLAHTADVVFLDAERVAEDVSPFAAGDAGASSNRADFFKKFCQKK